MGQGFRQFGRGSEIDIEGPLRVIAFALIAVFAVFGLRQACLNSSVDRPVAFHILRVPGWLALSHSPCIILRALGCWT